MRALLILILFFPQIWTSQAADKDSEWAGKIKNNKRDGWWVKTVGLDIEYLYKYKNDRVVAEYKVNRENYCEINNLLIEDRYYSLGTTCNGLLYSPDSGNIIKDADIKGKQLLHGDISSTHKSSMIGTVRNAIFIGTLFTHGIPYYKGKLIDGQKQGKAICYDSGNASPCLWKNNKRIDKEYINKRIVFVPFKNI